MFSHPTYPTDVHGMMPRTHFYKKNVKVGTIVVVVPLHYLRGMSDKCSSNLRIEMAYEITEQKYCNNIKTPMMRTVGRDYDAMTTNTFSDSFALDDVVIGNITLALNYFKFVKAFLEKNKEHPCSFELWNAAPKDLKEAV